MCDAPATAFTTENGAIGSRRITAIATMPFFASRRVMRFSRAPASRRTAWRPMRRPIE